MSDLPLGFRPIEKSTEKPTTSYPLGFRPVEKKEADPNARPGGVVMDYPVKGDIEDEILSSELTKIGKQHKLSPKQMKELQDSVVFLGADIRGRETSKLGRGLQILASGPAMELPQKARIVWEKYAGDENLSKALDDVHELALARKSLLRDALEAGATMATGAGGAAGLLGRGVLKATQLGAKLGSTVAGGAALGATFAGLGSIGESRGGEEFKDIGEEAAVGAAFGALAPGAIKLFRRAKTLVKGADELADSAGTVREAAEAYSNELKNSKVATRVLPSNELDKAVNFFNDEIPVAKMITQRSQGKIDGMKLIDDLSYAHNKATSHSLPWRTLAADISSEIADLDPKTRDSMFRELNNGVASTPVAKRVQRIFNELRREAQREGIEVNYRQNYLPKLRKGTAEYVAATKYKLEELGIDILEGVDKEDFAKVKAVPGWLDELQRMSGMDGQITNPAELSYAIGEVINKADRVAMRINGAAFFTKARSGSSLPEFLQETNPSKLIDRYSHALFQEAYLREPLERLGKAANGAAEGGDMISSEFLGRIQRDLLGERKKLAASARRLETKMSSYFLLKSMRSKAAGNNIASAGYELLATSPKVVGDISSLVYSNVIGLRAKPAFENMTTLAFNVSSDFAGAGTTQATKGAYSDLWNFAMNGKSQEIVLQSHFARRIERSIRNLGNDFESMGKNARREVENLLETKIKSQADLDNLQRRAARGLTGERVRTTSMNNLLENEGLVPAEIKREMTEAYRDSFVRASKMGSKLAQVRDGLVDSSMYLFRKSEIAGRASGYFFSRRLMDSAMTDKKIFQSLIKSVDDPGYRRRISDAVALGDKDTATRELAKFINSNNFYNYDRATMSQMGKEMGGLFSTLSKWPTRNLGEVYSSFRRNGFVKGSMDVSSRMFLPFAVLYGIDATVIDGLRETLGEERVNKVIGSGGLSKMTRATAVPGVDWAIRKAQGEYAPATVGSITGLGSTPMLQLIDRGVTAVLEGDTKKVKRIAARGAETYLPGASWVKFLGEEIPEFLTGKKATGKDVTERLQSGAKLYRRVGKDTRRSLDELINGTERRSIFDEEKK